jgi:hypothetical protein
MPATLTTGRGTGKWGIRSALAARPSLHQFDTNAAPVVLDNFLWDKQEGASRAPLVAIASGR